MTIDAFAPTADLSDTYGDRLASCTTTLREYGGRPHAYGRISTVRCHEDNALVRAALSEPAEGRVLVVDGGGSPGRALVGDVLAGLAAGNGWAGVVVHGRVRDAAALAGLPLSVKALGTNPRRGAKAGAGERDVPVEFGGVVFRPGDVLVSDEDGIVVLPAGG
jgi:regulator of ribonuclease activity A